MDELNGSTDSNTTDACPTCGSPEPKLHPAVQAEGEVTHICGDAFHVTETLEEVPLFESPATGGQDAQDVSSEGDDKSSRSANHCSFCRRRVSMDDPTTHSEITSWVKGAKKDSPVLREYTGRVACGDCITKLRSGVSPNTPDFEAALELPATEVTDESIFTDRSEEWRTGFSVGYSGLDLDPSAYGNLTYKQINDYRDGWLAGCDKIALDNLHRDIAHEVNGVVDE